MDLRASATTALAAAALAWGCGGGPAASVADATGSGSSSGGSAGATAATLDLASPDLPGAPPCDDLAIGDHCFVEDGPRPAGLKGQRIVVADADDDGHPDLLVPSVGDGSVRVFLGDGTGELDALPPVAVDSVNTDVAVADFDGDGAADLLVTDYPACQVHVHVRTGRGYVYAMTRWLGTDTYPGTVALDDLNGDGRVDVVTTGPGRLAVALADATGFPGEEVALYPVAAAESWSALHLVDLDADGSLDALLDGAILLRGSPTGALGQPEPTGLSAGRTTEVGIGGIGFVLARDPGAEVRGALQTVTSPAPGQLAAEDRLPLSHAAIGWHTTLAAGPVLVAASGSPGTATLHVADPVPAGGWSDPLGSAPLDLDPATLVAVDLDADGVSELAALDGARANLRVWRYRAP